MGLNMVGASVIVPDSSDGTDPENPYADGKWSLIAEIMKNRSHTHTYTCSYNTGDT